MIGPVHIAGTINVTEGGTSLDPARSADRMAERTIASRAESLPMPIELTHIGEDLVAAMLESLCHRNELSRVVCEVSGSTLADDIDGGRLGEAIHFRADDANLIVESGKRTFSCDGEQKIDVLCAGEDRAIAFEAKLGIERMGAAQFHRRFCTPCEKSKHSDNRISGSMVAILERSLPFEGDCNLVALTAKSQWHVGRTWWLVLRQSIVTKWRKAGSFPVTSARLVSFDALAHLYGSRQQFDELVQRVVGVDFSARWGIPLKDSGRLDSSAARAVR